MGEPTEEEKEETKRVMRRALTVLEGYLGDDGRVDMSRMTDDLIRLAHEVKRLERENAGLREALKQVVSVGHNDDCLFCGFKDKAALAKQEEK